MKMIKCHTTGDFIEYINADEIISLTGLGTDDYQHTQIYFVHDGYIDIPGNFSDRIARFMASDNESGILDLTVDNNDNRRFIERTEDDAE